MIFNIFLGLWAFTLLAVIATLLFAAWLGVQELRHWWAGKTAANRCDKPTGFCVQCATGEHVQ